MLLARHSAAHPSVRRSSTASTAKSARTSRIPRCVRVNAQSPQQQQQPALLLELDGAVVDLHMDGHRQAFNKAFLDLGFECVSWSPQLYNDLLGRGDGTPEGFIAAYFELVGWPQMMATSDRELFLKKVHEAKQEEMFKMLQSGGVPLRDGVQEVMKQALAEGSPVALISGTHSEMAESVVTNALMQLPPEVSGSLRVYQSNVVPQGDGLSSSGRQQAQEEGSGPVSLESQIREGQRDEKQRQAINFAEAFAASSSTGSSGIGIDPNLLAASSRQAVTPEWLRAVASTLHVSPSRCLFLGSTNSIIQAAATAGMTAAAMPRKYAARGSYENAKAKYTGYGAGDCTWRRLRSLLPAQ